MSLHGAPLALAIDIGGTKVDAALVDSDGLVQRASVSRRPTGRAASRDEIARAIRDASASALSHVPASRSVAGIGVGSAGPVDLPGGSISPLNLPAAHGLVLAEVLVGLVADAPVTLALDGTCIALAEHSYGALVGCETALAMVVSTGVGGGFIAHGRAVGGASGNAGHIGQIRVRTLDASDPAASSLEAIAAGPATVAWACAQGWTGTTGEELGAAYRAGDEVARRAVIRSATAVGEAITTAATLYDLEAVAVAGGFVQVADDYLDHVRASAHSAALHPYARAVRISPSALDGDGPLIGAAALVWQGI
ncbi:glucokinase [Microbacterium halimionae]|uniref:Glucokinase n=1 Tax=Microbacterium halimionae TaxID=1526413 RepID=A0A7W3PM54_9MICO|nr:ROK family protein [Microbacterium halimionae]MBA8816716.1 glucokinase [Microbacterium halimionae]NII94988.1 glucokinase [Microbacterium halimionae]